MWTRKFDSTKLNCQQVYVPEEINTPLQLRINADISAGSAIAAATVRNDAGLYPALVVMFGAAAGLVKTGNMLPNTV